MSTYTPGKIRVLLESWGDYLACGKVPPLRYDSSGWHLCDPGEQVHQKIHKGSDGLEAVRMRADIKDAARPQGHHTAPLTRGERVYIVSRYFAGFQEWEAADMAGIDRNRTRRTFYEATEKMARNLGWKMVEIRTPEMAAICTS